MGAAMCQVRLQKRQRTFHGPQPTGRTMPLLPDEYRSLLAKAVAHYWSTLRSQSDRQRGTDSDRGARAAVTGGKQMDGFCELVRWLAEANGMPYANIYVRNRLELPGYFRPTKKWDMLVVHESCLVAAIEFKSQVGPSFGNNLNNRTEEALGNATDLWTAYREGAFGRNQPRPWLGWVMLLEDCPESNAPVEVKEPHFSVFPEFMNSSYAGRYEILLRKLILEKLYDSAAFLMATREGGLQGKFKEPSADLSARTFLVNLAARIRTHLETR
jgi:restriction endonuclease XhoI-like protein